MEIIDHLPKSYQLFYKLCEDAGLKIMGLEEEKQILKSIDNNG